MSRYYLALPDVAQTVDRLSVSPTTTLDDPCKVIQWDLTTDPGTIWGPHGLLRIQQPARRRASCVERHVIPLG